MARKTKAPAKPSAAPKNGSAKAHKELETEIVDASTLRPHPRNYRSHPEDQILHLGESLKQHGFYRNVVIARDGTILAGHGIVQAAAKMGLSRIPVFRLDLDPAEPRALKVLAGDNELPRFSDNDDRALSEILRDIMKQDDLGLLGTGYDEKSLAALLMVTRPASEIASIDEASEWVGMPEYDPSANEPKLIITFSTKDGREQFVKRAKLEVRQRSSGMLWTAHLPPTKSDPSAVRFVAR